MANDCCKLDGIKSVCGYKDKRDWVSHVKWGGLYYVDSVHLFLCILCFMSCRVYLIKKTRAGPFVSHGKRA